MDDDDDDPISLDSKKIMSRVVYVNFLFHYTDRTLINTHFHLAQWSAMASLIVAP